MTSSTRHFTRLGHSDPFWTPFRRCRKTVQITPGTLSKLNWNGVQNESECCPNKIGIASKITRNTHNAVKFVRPGVVPRIRVSGEARDGWVRVNVRDNGIGIPIEYQHRLFKMFEKIHPATEYEGTGVGLAIVRRAAGRVGGRVGMESDGENGSVFWVELPHQENNGL